MNQFILRTFLFGLFLIVARSTVGSEPVRQLRRPVAGAVVNKSTVAIANSASGSVCLLNWKTDQVISERTVGTALSDIARVSEAQLLAIDEAAHELIELHVQGRAGNQQLSVQSRLKIRAYPVDLVVSADKSWGAVTSLWSRSISILDLHQQPRVAQTVDLPFAPRNILLLEEDKRIVVSSAFGGRIAVLKRDDHADVRLESDRTIPGHNIRQLALRSERNERRLEFTQQILNELARPVQDDIHWGMFVGNGIRSLSVDTLLRPDDRLLKNAQFFSVGDAGHGAGDPEAFAQTADGRTVVTIAGSNSLAVIEQAGHPENRVPTPARPTALIAVSGTEFVVLNKYADSVSVMNIRNPDPAIRESDSVVFPEVQIDQRTIALGPQPELTASQRGEILFHSAGLSHDNWFSCHSCHTDGHSAGLLVDTLSDGDYGAAKRILSLRGVAGTEPLAWNGSMDFLQQIRKSAHDTMQGRPLSDRHARDLVAYVKSLPPIPTPEEMNLPVDTVRVERGRQVFRQNKCGRCHAGTVYTSAKTYDVGLTDDLNTDKFNPPSLRGLTHRSAFFHDNRARTLEAVFRQFAHPDGRPLPEDQVTDLVHFLRSL